MLPNERYKEIWNYVEKNLQGKLACKYIVTCLHMAAKHDCETELADFVLKSIERSKLVALSELRNRFGDPAQELPDISITQHNLSGYDELLLTKSQGVCYA